jgi:cell division septal protein FtsQ
MSYRKRHVKFRIHKAKPRKSIFKRLWFWILILFLIIVFTGCYFLIFYSGAQIKDIVIFGNQKVATSDIENLISGNISHRILGIGDWQISSKSIFLIDSDKLSKEILNKFPVIEAAEIKRKFMQTLQLQINERAPVAVFCQADENAAPENEDCYFIDKNGIIFEAVHAVPQEMAIVRQNTHVALFIGEKAVQGNIMDLFVNAEKNLKDNFQISIKNAKIVSPAKLNVQTDEGWLIYFDLSENFDIDSQITKLNLLLSNKLSAGPEGYTRKNLRYIDLRPRDRAVVCDNSACGQY